MKADKATVTRLLKTARGQIDGILKMIEEDKYCLEISNQVMAAQSVLKRANYEIIQAHLENCVCEAFENGNPEEKIKEIMSIIDKLSK